MLTIDREQTSGIYSLCKLTKVSIGYHNCCNVIKFNMDLWLNKDRKLLENNLKE